MGIEGGRALIGRPHLERAAAGRRGGERGGVEGPRAHAQRGCSPVRRRCAPAKKGQADRRTDWGGKCESRWGEGRKEKGGAGPARAPREGGGANEEKDSPRLARRE